MLNQTWLIINLSTTSSVSFHFMFVILELEWRCYSNQPHLIQFKQSNCIHMEYTRGWSADFAFALAHRDWKTTERLLLYTHIFGYAPALIIVFLVLVAPFCITAALIPATLACWCLLPRAKYLWRVHKRFTMGFDPKHYMVS